MRFIGWADANRKGCNEAWQNEKFAAIDPKRSPNVKRASIDADSLLGLAALLFRPFGAEMAEPGDSLDLSRAGRGHWESASGLPHVGLGAA